MSIDVSLLPTICPPFAHHSAGLCQWNLCPLVPVPTWGHMESIHQGRRRSRRALHSASRTFRELCRVSMRRAELCVALCWSSDIVYIISLSSPLSPTFYLSIVRIHACSNNVHGCHGESWAKPGARSVVRAMWMPRFLQWSPDQKYWNLNRSNCFIFHEDMPDISGLEFGTATTIGASLKIFACWR